MGVLEVLLRALDHELSGDSFALGAVNQVLARTHDDGGRNQEE